MKTKEYTITIDTNSYAGNFERELTAYLTGRLGDSEVGKKYAEMFLRDFHIDYTDDENDPFTDSINGKHGDFGWNWCEISGNDSTNINLWFLEEPTEEQIEILIKRCKEFCTLYNETYKERKEPLKIDAIHITVETTIRELLRKYMDIQRIKE